MGANAPVFCHRPFSPDVLGLYRDFGVITRGALRHALAEWDLHLSPADEETVMKAYDALRVSPEVPSALKAIEGNSLVEAVIFSNGTDAMVGASVESSPDLSPYHNLFKGLITVEELGVFKPNKRTYDHLLKAVRKEGSPEHVWLVSGNPFDIVGARAAGLQAAWIDRVGKGWVDCLGDVIGDIKPTVVVSGVDKAITEIIKTTSVGS